MNLYRRGIKDAKVTWRNFKRKDSFTRNLAYTLSGNAIAIAIGFLFTPILTRIYTPEAYGAFSFFIAVGQNVGSLATLQLTRAFVLPESETTFKRLLTLSIITSTLFSLITLIIFNFWGREILSFFKAESLASFILLIPLVIFLSALNDIVRSWNIRLKEFKKAGSAKIVSTASSRTGSIIAGIITSGSTIGLLLGEIIYKCTDTLFLISHKLKGNAAMPGKINASKLISTLKEYRSYPLYILPANWLSGLSNQLPVYFLLASFNAEVVGHFSLASRMLNIPAILIINSLAPVFLQRVAQHYRETPEQIPVLVGKLVSRLLLITLIPFLLLMFFSESIFVVFLGQQWQLAGQFAFMLGIFYPFFILSSSMISIFRIFGKEFYSFAFNAIGFALIAMTFWFGVRSNDIFYTLILYSGMSVIVYSFQMYLVLKVVGYKNFKQLFIGLLLFVIVSGFTVWLKLH